MIPDYRKQNILNPLNKYKYAKTTIARMQNICWFSFARRDMNLVHFNLKAIILLLTINYVLTDQQLGNKISATPDLCIYNQ